MGMCPSLGQFSKMNLEMDWNFYEIYNDEWVHNAKENQRVGNHSNSINIIFSFFHSFFLLLPSTLEKAFSLSQTVEYIHFSDSEKSVRTSGKEKKAEKNERKRKTDKSQLW